MVKKEEEVLAGELLGQTEEKLEEFDLARILAIQPSRVADSLFVLPEAEVKVGQALAQKKSLLKKSVFKSPVSGTLVGLTPGGILRIRVGEKNEIKSPVKATVKEVKIGEFLTLEFPAVVLLANFGKGLAGWGEIEVLTEEEEIGTVGLPPAPAGKILILRGKIPLIFGYKAEALGVVGVVGGSLVDEDKLQDLAVLVAGDKDGFLPQDLWDNLRKYQGKNVLIQPEEKKLKIPV